MEVVAADGLPMAIVGAVLSTTKVELGPDPDAKWPTVSEAVPEAIEIPNVPSPEMPDNVTVRVVPLPETTMPEAVALLVLTKVMLPADKVAPLKLGSE